MKKTILSEKIVSSFSILLSEIFLSFLLLLIAYTVYRETNIIINIITTGILTWGLPVGVGVGIFEFAYNSQTTYMDIVVTITIFSLGGFFLGMFTTKKFEI